jgi:hypothetical protein
MHPLLTLGLDALDLFFAFAFAVAVFSSLASEEPFENSWFKTGGLGAGNRI